MTTPPAPDPGPPRAGGRWVGDLLALAAGLLTPFAFAPYDWSAAALLAPAALLAVWHETSPRRSLWRGWLFGAGMFGFGIHWVHVSIHVYGHTALPVAILLTGLLAAYSALFPALAGWLYARLAPHPTGWQVLGLFPTLWVLAEWFRGWVFTGFPWLYLGYSQIETPLGGVAPVTGVLGVSWAAALTGALLFLLLLHLRDRRLPALPALGLAAVWVAGYGVGQLAWTTPAGPSIRVALLQGNIDQDIKWQLENRIPTLETYLGLMDPHWGDDLVVWPETAIPLFQHTAQPLLERLDELGKENGTALVTGIPFLDDATGRYYNGLLALGTAEGRYYKHHLVPFGDYVPLAEWLRGVFNFLNLAMSSFSAGPASQEPLRLGDLSIGAGICYEVAFAEETRNWLPESQLLINLSNDAWFGTSIGPHQHFQIARMRALEVGRPLLRATNTGITAIVDHRGETLARAPQFQAIDLAGRVQPMSGVTPFARFGERPVVFLALLAPLVAARFRPRTRQADIPARRPK